MENKRKQIQLFDRVADGKYEIYENLVCWRAIDKVIFSSWREKIKPKVRVLDIGCGNGRSTLKIADLDIKIEAFDISPKMVEKAIKRAEAKNITNVHFWIQDEEEYQYEKESFDYIIGYGVLHHLPNPENTFRNIAYALKPNGIYFGMENNVCIFRGIFNLLMRLLPLWHEEAGSTPVISQKDLIKWCKKAGLNLKVKSVCFLPPHLCELLGYKVSLWLLKLTDVIFGKIPLLRSQGGINLIEAQKHSS